MSSMKRKIPKSITVYNQLFQMILEGTYQQGDKLPGENQLAEMVGVSRMTLRQAINILCEDGIIERKQGIGNFVKKAVSQEEVGLEKIENPIYKSCNKKIERLDTTFTFVPAKKYEPYFNYIFKKPSAIMLMADRYYYGKDNTKLYTFSMISMDVLVDFDVDFEIKEEVEKFMEEIVYKKAYRSSLEVKYIPYSEFPKERKIESKHGIIAMLIEVIYDNKGEILIHNKHYFPIEAIELKANFFNR